MSRDEFVTVYNYCQYERANDPPVMAKYKAPHHTIVHVFKQVVLEGTGEEVSTSALDSQGRYRRVATGWGELA